MATMMRKKTAGPNPAVMAALAARAQQSAPPVQGIPGGAPDGGMPGGAPSGGMPGGMKKGGMSCGMKKGGKTKKMATGGAVTRGDGVAERGRTKGKNC